ncbi:VanW family protein [Nocardioides limicola]|uniref:VanW family protein n=1 Tax=Nocardioides limicola TaxID=2803368 RepID=UPI00193BDC0B|nr:VanW family protein [Nocardioides sp. DJM-14]
MSTDAGTATTTETPQDRGGRVVLWLLLALGLLLGGGYAAAWWVAGENVPRGMTVAGVDIGGHTPERAAEVLKAGLADRELATMTVSVDEVTREIPARRLGLSVDHEASVAAAGAGASWHPVRLWDYFTGGRNLDPVIVIDHSRLDEQLDGFDEQVSVEPVDAAVTFRAGRFETTDPAPGRALDRAGARAAIEAAYLGDDPVARLPFTPLAPEVGEEALTAAVDGFANPAVSGPVRLMFGNSPVRLNPRDFTAALRMVPEEGALSPRVRKRVFANLLDTHLSEDDKPVDATVRIVNSKPEVIPAKPGVSYDVDEVASVFLEVLTASGDDRRAEVPATVAEPEFSTADAEALGIVEQVSTFTTYYPHSTYRNVNIGRAAELIDGTLLKPGETFSMNDTVGERTRANGFTEGYIIRNGVLVQDLGGGVSQMATTLFNAMFFAGLKDVEHRPHSFYIDRYPEGREATVAWGILDLKFANDTEHGVLIQSRIVPSTPSRRGEVTVTMWSTKTWDITAVKSGRSRVTQPTTRYIQEPGCEPHRGWSGFDVTVTRHFHRPGNSAIVRSEPFFTRYNPSDSVVCGPPPSQGNDD